MSQFRSSPVGEAMELCELLGRRSGWRGGFGAVRYQHKMPRFLCAEHYNISSRGAYLILCTILVPGKSGKFVNLRLISKNQSLISNVGNNFPGLGNNFPGLGNNFPRLGNNFPGLGNNFPRLGNDFLLALGNLGKKLGNISAFPE